MSPSTLLARASATAKYGCNAAVKVKSALPVFDASSRTVSASPATCTIATSATGTTYVDLRNSPCAAGASPTAADDPVAAIAPATRALALRAEGKPEERAEAALALSRALWRSGRDKPRARSLAVQAEADYAAAGPGFVRELTAASTWRRGLDPR